MPCFSHSAALGARISQALDKGEKIKKKKRKDEAEESGKLNGKGEMEKWEIHSLWVLAPPEFRPQSRQGMRKMQNMYPFPALPRVMLLGEKCCSLSSYPGFGYRKDRSKP